jgi:hypothetical protein
VTQSSEPGLGHLPTVTNLNPVPRCTSPGGMKGELPQRKQRFVSIYRSSQAFQHSMPHQQQHQQQQQQQQQLFPQRALASAPVGPPVAKAEPKPVSKGEGRSMHEQDRKGCDKGLSSPSPSPLTFPPSP